jgi:pSer/pThr/pTyr-binding forkhead associated (FHA) protein
MSADDKDATRSFSPVNDPKSAGSSAQDARPTRPSTAPVGTALLTVIGDDLAVDYFALTGDEALIGRSMDAAVVLDDVTVSRQHAKLTRQGNQWTVKDLRSLNGTYVNKERVESSQLQDGDELQVGRFRFVFVSPEVTSG